MKREFTVPYMKIAEFDIENIVTVSGGGEPEPGVENSVTVQSAQTSLGTAKENTTLFVF